LLTVKLEGVPVKDDTSFDVVDDRTCLEPHLERLLAGASGMAEYQAPEHGYGSKTVQQLDAILENLCLTGVSRRGRSMPAFLLCLELLSQKLDLRVLETDKPHILGALLLRLLPESEALSKSLMMSILRVCAKNTPAAAKLPSFWTKYLEAMHAATKQKRSGILQKIGGMFSDGFDAAKFNADFLKTVCNTLQQESGKLVLTPALKPDACNTLQALTSFASPSHSTRLHAGLWCLEVGDATCGRRSYTADEHLLLLRPHPLLAPFLEYVGAEGGSVSESESEAPFEARFAVAQHKAAKTCNGKSVLRRLAGDTELYRAARKAAAKKGTARLKGLSDTSIREALRGTAAAARGNMLKQLIALEAALLEVPSYAR
jgi:hypothetical protein